MKQPMKNTIIIQRIMRDDFDNEFLIAYARVVIAFGRLENLVKLAIKNLAVSMKISADFTGGIAEAERQNNFSAMCDYMVKLHGDKHGENNEGDELKRWVEEAKKFAEVRNKILHGSLTIEDDGTPIVLHTKLDRKNKAVEFTEATITKDALKHMHKKLEKLWKGLNVVRQGWTKTP
jgi:hypothetical protein